MPNKKDNEKDGIFKMYFDLTKQAVNDYGKNSVVLLQVGSFYEIYGLTEEDGSYSGSNITDVATCCRMNIRPKHLTFNDKEIVMAGFPDKENAVEKFLHYINEGGFTSVIYSQDENNPTVRSFDSVVSPGTYLSNNEIKLQNNIVCITLEVTKGSKKKNPIIFCGISNINVITGDSCVYEYQTPYSKSHTIYDELERFISIKEPSEVIIISPFDKEQCNKIKNYANIKCNTIHYISSNDPKAKKSNEQVFQFETFHKYFSVQLYNTTSLLNEKTVALQSITYLLYFIVKHNPSLIKKVNFPEFEDKNNDVRLANHTLQQLNIIQDNNFTGKLSSLVNLLDHCKSSIGKRRYLYEITHPTVDQDYLNKEYNMTEHLINNYELVETIRKKLYINDIAYLLRKSIMKKVTPLEVLHFYKSLNTIKVIYDTIIHDSNIFEYVYNRININVSSECSNIIDEINSTYDITLCEKYETMDIDENIFNSGVDMELDNLVKKYEENWKIMKIYQEQLDITLKMDEKKKTPTNNDYVKLESTEKRGYSLICTKTRFSKLKKLLEISNSSLIITSSPSNQSNVIIESNEFVEPLANINKLRKSIKDLVNKLHIDFLEIFSNKKEKINSIITFVEMIDNIQNRAFVAEKYNYSKPSILSFLSSSSCVAIKDLRHPLIELIHDEPYVANDLELGREKKGLLIYGTNAVGKTSLIRALGMSVVMAQCGYFVPASSFEYIPYKKIFSRILNTDNLFKGLSTFAVEMSELNVILNGSDSNSLILGDELCSGTEMDSAKAIFVSGLQNIYSKNSSFIFATHLHEITEYDEISNLEKLSMKHMTVHYDYEDDKMVYDRKLKEGPGESMYGLEVCKSLNMPQDFLENAYSLRDKYLNEVSVLDSKKSRYNSKKLINICEICKKNPASETHHKVEQKMADKNGFIGNIHKDHISNLIGICEECHKTEHKISSHTI